MDKAGAGAYFTQLAFALLGHMRGGPAKASVVSSALNGIVSGSSIANVVTGGVFTISLMKRVGYTPVQAGAIETSSSVNGQLMPPVMGAAAFLMVEYVGIPYSQVVMHAALPAVISYIALYYIVHLEALKLGLRPIPKSGPARTWLPGSWACCSASSSPRSVCGAVYYGVRLLKPLFGDWGFWGFTLLLLIVYVGLVAYASRFPDLPEEDPDKPIEALPPAGPTFKVRAALPSAGRGAGLVPDRRAALAGPVRLLRHRADDRDRGDAKAVVRALPRPGRARRARGATACSTCATASRSARAT